MSDLQYHVEKLELELTLLDDRDRQDALCGQNKLCSKWVDIQDARKIGMQAEKSKKVARQRPELLREIKTALLDYG